MTIGSRVHLPSFYNGEQRQHGGRLCLYTKGNEQKVFFPLCFRPILHHCAEITVTGVSEETHPLRLSSEERKLRVPGVDTKDFEEDFGDGQDFYRGLEWERWQRHFSD